MSYKKIGLGWSEPVMSSSPSTNWLGLLLSGPIFGGRHWGHCDISHMGEQLTSEICFEPGEESIAEESGCVVRDRYDCVTSSGADGSLWCCRPGFPRPYYQPSTTATTPEGTPVVPELPPVDKRVPEAQAASFFAKLLQPGPMIAIGLFSLAGVLLYHNWRSQ